jgi:DNA polymerase I-like protein with 3'-5' exonuclease and polymerase domains/uracil-DNA glycosylase
MKVLGYGPAQADIVIVGEAPGQDEELEGRPFVGASGKLLRTMLREAGINPDKAYYTNVCKYRPPGNKIDAWVTASKKVGMANEWPEKDGRYYNEAVGEGLDELLGEIAGRNPRVVIGLGNVALWALTGEWGITDWRGSEMSIAKLDAGVDIPFVPTLHPAAILRSWDTRAQAAHDLKFRVVRRLRGGFETPEWDHNWSPTFNGAIDFIMALEGDVAVDVETSRGQTVCVGLATSARRAMCIPFISEGYGAYWTHEEKSLVISTLHRKLCNIKVSLRVNVIGQNFNYDESYFDDNFDFIPRVAFDTLIAQSVLFPGTPRGLGYLSSMYCDWHCYWKDDARDWQNLRDFARLFEYNCRDVCATWEAAQGQRLALQKAGLMDQFMDRVKYNHHVYDMMQQGVIRDAKRTAALDDEIEEALQERKIIICNASGRAINPTSPTQVSKLLYEDWGCRKPARRGKEAGGTGDEELKQVAIWHPERADVCTAILEHRSLASMRSNFLRAKLDPDGKLRSSFMATGTETFRLTSSKNNFGRGTNLLNVSGSGTTHSGNKVPNFRSAIVPPSGHTYFDCDLARADLQVVAWEADDADLKAKFREGADIHEENAKDLYGVGFTPVQREKSKKFVHLTDYYGKARTCAIAVGCTVHEADLAQRKWFAMHPGIAEWHKRIQAQLEATRTVMNKFGYRRIFLDRIEGILPEALAWIPQSTIAIVASKVHMNMDALGVVTVTLQCYDSVAGYFPTVLEEEALAGMFAATQVVVPYDDPLIVPMGLKTSTESWGECEKRKWPKF